MLVITFAVQLHARDYIQCTNEDSNAKKKKKRITLLHSKGIDCSVKINTLHCPAN